MTKQGFSTGFTFIIFLAGLLFWSCGEIVSDPDKDDGGLGSIDVPGDFDFDTIKEVTVRLQALANDGSPKAGIRFDVRLSGPDNSGALGTLLISGETNASGLYEPVVQVGIAQDSLFVEGYYIGALNNATLPIVGGEVSFTLGGPQPPRGPVSNTRPRLFKTSVSSLDYIFLGSWDSQGTPNYLEAQRDIIDQSLLDDLNVWLPEHGGPIPEIHSEYLAEGNQTNFAILDSCSLWITFVHEGAGWKNAVGFYTYDINNPPQLASDIDSVTIVFPNCSYQNGGGGLQSGDKVFLGSFPQNTVVGWALIAQGWNQGNQTVDNGSHQIFSNPAANPEAEDSLKQHNVLLYDAERQLILVGFEDIRRDQNSCDHDFNDAVFYITASDINCIDVTDIIPPDDLPGDADNDGVPDVNDDYPTDPDRAFTYSYPGLGTYATIAFEDDWPLTGDYDFNDLIIDYNYLIALNANNEAVDFTGSFILRAAGSSKANGFGLSLPVLPGDIASVSGVSLTGGYINLDANGLEAGHSTEAVVIVYDNVLARLNTVEGELANTEKGIRPVPQDTTQISMLFTLPLTLAQLGFAPYNPFLIVAGERGHEIHLKNHAPTALADLSLLATESDDSNPGTNRYYTTSSEIPWAISTPESFAYPFEEIEITNAHLLFATWAQSGGITATDWYTDQLGYRIAANIYRAFGVGKRR